MDDKHARCRRHNYVAAAYVEAALHINATLGSDRAYWILMRENVPADVIDRVLRREAGRLRRKDRRYGARRDAVASPEPPPADARVDTMTSQRVEVALVFQSMLGTNEAAEYLRDAGVPIWVSARVLGSRNRRPSPELVVEGAPVPEN